MPNLSGRILEEWFDQSTEVFSDSHLPQEMPPEDARFEAVYVCTLQRKNISSESEESLKE